MAVSSENDSLSECGSRRDARKWAIPLAAVSLLLIGLLFWFQRSSSAVPQKLVEAEAAVLAGDFRTAQRLARDVLRRDPDNPRAQLVTAKCLHSHNRPQPAVDLLTDVAATHPPLAVEAACLAGDILFFELYRPCKAELMYRQALQRDPGSLEANGRLAVLLAITGQWWQHIPARLATMRHDQFNAMDLLVLALAEKALLNPELAVQMEQVSPDDPLVLLATARLAVEDERHGEAIRKLTQAVAIDPSLIQAQVLLGTEFFQLDQQSQFVQWLHDLPPAADEHPGIWILRGKWAQQQDHPAAALRCFCEAVHRDPNHPDGLYQAGRILESMGRRDAAVPFFERSQSLQTFNNAVKAADSPDALPETEQAAKLAESLGNVWEAWGWASMAVAHPGRPEWAQQLTSRLRPLLRDLPLQRTLPKHNPATAFDYGSLPAFDSVTPARSTSTAAPLDGSADRFTFRDRAASAGIDFRYFNGSADVTQGTRHMYEVMGGGVAVLDLNGDDRPDLYFTQGGPWQDQESSHGFLDRLFLNRGAGKFADVTAACGIVENGFSQGATVGDFDSDGFPDVLVANIGRNRLFRNNGDGTFRDMSGVAGFERSDWTTSCAVADLSGDGHPEIFFVNYLEGNDLFTRTCGPQHDRVCLPQHFPASANRLYWNSGNEQFQDVTETSGIDVAEGKSLGIVAGLLDDSAGLDLFVANDTVSNFYFQNQGPAANGEPRFRELAMVSGLAVSGDGTAQACMGVAAGDADGDGATDLFITNFHGESNTLLRQLPGGIFDDITLSRQLRQPSLSKLGFGTQFLDADLDGQLDLVVANGHIDDFRDDGRTEYQMQPQFFANQGPAGFREVGAETLGTYFSRKLLGRSLARLDWNSDGREEFVVTHLDAPVALLENTTPGSGNYVVVQLYGILSNRDAIGTVVQVETDHHSLMRQLTAGDGFQASNQRVLTFGLGDNESIRRLTVTWPSGRRNEYTSVAANTRWMIIEDRQSLFPSPEAM